MTLTAYAPLIVIALVSAFVIWVIKRGSDAHMRRLSADAHAFVERIQQERVFPPAQSSIVPDRLDQPVLFAEGAAMLELRSKARRRYAGTRVRIAGLPIYLGGSSPATSTSIQETSEGELALTTQSLVFSGNRRSQNMPLKRISGLQAMSDTLQINLDGRTKPLWFRVRNPILWAAIVQIVMQSPMRGRELLGAGRIANDLAVSLQTAQPAQKRGGGASQ